MSLVITEGEVAVTLNTCRLCKDRIEDVNSRDHRSDIKKAPCHAVYRTSKHQSFIAFKGGKTNNFSKLLTHSFFVIFLSFAFYAR